MSIRENWAKSLTEQGKQLYKLDNDGDLALFVSKDNPRNDPKDETPVENWNCRLPMYHVWRGDQWLMTTADADVAYKRFEKEREQNDL